MNKQSKKMYSKAMKYYQEGYLNKAIAICEKGMSQDMKNSPIINLKGLILYLKGDLSGAKAVWGINREFNNDEIAKKYLKDINQDAEREKLYNEALNNMKVLRISEAIELLTQCSESDFNTINVSNALGFCYIKQGEFAKAKECTDKVLSLDAKNKSALGNRKILVDYGIINREVSYKKIIYFGVSIAAIFLIFFLTKYYAYPSFAKLYKSNKAETVSKHKEDTKKEPSKLNSEDKNISAENNNVKKETSKREILPSQDIKTYIDKKDYLSLYSAINPWKGKDLGLNEKALINKAESILKEEGVVYFYKAGTECVKAKDYDKAISNFEKAYEYGENNYLNEHVVYMMAISYEKKEDIEKALKYYEIYNKNFTKGDYKDEALYKLAMIYKNIDKQKSKEYAETLNKDFPKSMYNNSSIKAILSNN